MGSLSPSGLKAAKLPFSPTSQLMTHCLFTKRSSFLSRRNKGNAPEGAKPTQVEGTLGVSGEWGTHPAGLMKPLTLPALSQPDLGW